MTDSGKDLNFFLDIAKKRKLMIIYVSCAIFGITILFTFSRVPWFRSVAMLEVELKRPELTKPAGEEANTEAIYVSTQLGKLKSRSIVELFVTQMELDLDPEFSIRTGLISSIVSGLSSILFREDSSNTANLGEIKKKNRLIQAVLDRISAQPLQKSNLIKVGFDAKDPFQAKRLLDNFLELCVSYNSEQKRKDLQFTVASLETELQESEKKLLDSETELVKFVSKSGLVPSNDGGFGPVMDQMKRQMETILKTRELRGKYQALDDKAESNKDDFLGNTASTEYVNKMQAELASLEVEDRRMSAVYNVSFPKRATLRRQITTLRQRIDEAQKQAVSGALNTIKKEELLSKEYLEGIKTEAMRVNALSSQSTLLMRKVNMNREMHTNVLKQYLETMIRSRSVVSDIHIVDSGSLNTEPLWPPKALFLCVGIVISLLSGVLSAFTREFADRSIQTSKRIQNQFDVRELGSVPDLDKISSGPENDALTRAFLVQTEPQSFFSSALRNIQTSISFLVQDTDIRSWVLSSAIPGEGKSFVSVALSYTYTLNKSKKVLLVDADLREPSLSSMFNETKDKGGLTTLLQSPDMPLDTVIHRHETSGLFYMLAGPVPEDPTSLLASDRLREICDLLKKEFDVIIFDSPPILPFPDTRILSRVTDAIILLARQGHVTEFELGAAIDAMRSTQKARILGLILNKASISDRAYRHYQDYYSGKNAGSNGSSRKWAPRIWAQWSERPRGV